MLPKCLIYVRFSTLEQLQGASIDRQRDLCIPYAESQGWDYEIKIDEGRSAFHGANRDAGTVLGEFEREVRRGEHHGRVLLVERLDRISRLDWDETSDFLKFLNKNGVTVATVDGPRIYRPGERIDTGPLIELIVKIKMAHEQSLDKQAKLRDKWARHRDAAAKGVIITKTGPAWLTLSEDRRKWVADKRKVALVQRMFELSDEGMGAKTIAKLFNNEKVPLWPRYKVGKGGRDRSPKAWDRTTIGRILSNEAVIGDKQFYMEEGGKKVPAGEPIRQYYPQIIDTDLYLRVNNAAPDRKLVAGGRSGVVVNIAAALTKCAECGSSMTYLRGVRAGQTRMRNGKDLGPAPFSNGTLVCAMANRDGGCGNKTGVAYLGFERALLDTTLHLSIDDKLFSDDDEVGRLAKLMADAERDAEIARNKSANLWRGYSESGSDMAMRIAIEADAKLKAIETGLASLNNARNKAAGAVDAAEHLSRLATLRDELYADDLDVRRLARSKVAQGLVAIIDRIDCGADKIVTVHFTGGGRYLTISPGRGRARPVTRHFDLGKDGDDASHISDPSERAKHEAYLRRAKESRAKERAAG